MKAVSNSSPLIYLAKINSLILLQNIYSEIYIPPEVYNECVTQGMVNNHPDAILISDAVKIGWVKVKKPDIKINLDFITNLHSREREAIKLALSFNKEYPILLDELEARTYARTLGIRIKGVLGILIINARNNYITQEDAKRKLDALNDIMFLSADLYSKVLHELSLI
ncbi:MAG: hypothetical protein EU530_10185 [Promethearchaeota archaeon]|nr:MAG: hypothetical protein EU530_10185 [Candidatus Lokiarchaeota archaeon]